MSDDGDRPKRSWREIDQRRDGSGPQSRDEKRPKGRHAEARAEEATKQYVRELDKMFSSSQGGAEGEELAKAVRAAHGTSELATVCRAFRDKAGYPNEVALLSIFLDSADPELVPACLEHMLDLQSAGNLELTSGLKAQLRVLAGDFDDAIAGAAEDLLEAL